MNNKNENITLRGGAVVDPLVLKILARQGICSQQDIGDFLEPQLKDLPAPEGMLNLEKAAEIAGEAVLENRSILIWGDYDVDGTTATALLLLFFRAIQCPNVEYYIPNRLTEGYGLQTEPLRRICKNIDCKDKVLITVDNGISAHEAVNTANELGFNVIVTDHHIPPEKQVDAAAILNPRQEDCTFSGKNLAGVGVAFYLAIGIRSYLQKKGYFNGDIALPNLKQFLDLVAVGTVADMVSLDKPNRILVRAGLEVIAGNSNPGITALCLKSNIDSTLLRSEDIAFQLAPKINAAGRLGVADNAVSLLTSDSNDASRWCSRLSKNNDDRKTITLDNYRNALHYVKTCDFSRRETVVVAGNFHIGVAGIVASKLVEKFHKPALVLCEHENGLYKGSGRSVDGINLYDALNGSSEYLDAFGGHAMAAGLTLKRENLKKFQSAFCGAIENQKRNIVQEDKDDPAEEATIQNLFTDGLLKQLYLLEPHGIGNPQPIFTDQRVSFKEVRQIGKDKDHLRIVINSGMSTICGIGFGMGELFRKCKSRTDKCITYSPSLNFYNNRRSWQARVIDIQFVES